MYCLHECNGLPICIKLWRTTWVTKIMPIVCPLSHTTLPLTLGRRSHCWWHSLLVLHFDMCTVVANVTGSVGTQLTLVWLFTRVSADVLLQVLIAGSSVVTVGAGMGPIASVGREVNTELLSAGGHVGALRTPTREEKTALLLLSLKMVVILLLLLPLQMAPLHIQNIFKTISYKIKTPN